DWKLKLPYKGNERQPWRTAVAAHDTLLFNLREDIGEQQNLLAEAPEQKKKILERMQAHMNQVAPLPPPLKVMMGDDKSHYERQKAWWGMQRRE
ncbi:MAG: hypothetical protein AAFV07_07720, partial [Bacteroidota bacterium]